MGTEGDAFFVAFASAKRAVLCALEVQQALAAHKWPDGGRVRVRMGIHTGQAVPDKGDYTGMAVHRAARICSAACGGQVLVPQATQNLIEDEEEELEFTLVDLGERRLKDLDRPVRLFQLAAPGLGIPTADNDFPNSGPATAGPVAPSADTTRTVPDRPDTARPAPSAGVRADRGTGSPGARRRTSHGWSATRLAKPEP